MLDNNDQESGLIKVHIISIESTCTYVCTYYAFTFTGSRAVGVVICYILSLSYALCIIIIIDVDIKY